MADAPLDKIYTADEASERLRLTKRAIIKLGRDIGACSIHGRQYLFSENDILDLWQALRAPPISYAGRVVHIPRQSEGDIAEYFKWRGSRPPTNCDARVLEILRWLSAQRSPKTFQQIERAGKKTVDEMLRKGFVTKAGETTDGLALVKIAPAGNQQIAIFDKWKRKAEERRLRGGR